MSETELEHDYILEIINPTDSINNQIDKLFILLIKTQNEGKNFKETKHFINKCITISTQSNNVIFNWLKFNQNESKYVFFLGIYYYYNMLKLEDKDSNNKGFI